LLFCVNFPNFRRAQGITRGVIMQANIKRLPLTGAYNVRDLGGYGPAGGGTTCYGSFLRGDSLHELTDADIGKLFDYGVRTVIDLRELEEAKLQPGRLNGLPEVTVHHVPLLAALAPALGGALPTDLGETYVLCARHCTAALKRVFELLARSEVGGVLFHCAVGKDRTGIVAALLLELAGVPREVVLSDYSASEVFLRPLVERLIRQHRQDPATGVHPDFLICDPKNMERLLDTLRSDYGGAESYLRAIGLSDQALERLKRRSVCPQAAAEGPRELVESHADLT
jgi:protein-tyrosine phosphatase